MIAARGDVGLHRRWEIRVVAPGSTEGLAARDLQLVVLRPNGPVPGDTGPQPDQQVLIATDLNGNVVGAATVCPQPWPRDDIAQLPALSWRFRSLAVSDEFRGSGVGSALVRAAEEAARDRGAATLWAEVRMTALVFYERLGWVPLGEVWDKPGVGPHRYAWIPVGGSSGADECQER